MPTEIENFKDKMEQIIDALGIEALLKTDILNELNNFNDSDKYKLLNDPILEEKINELVNQDQLLNDFYNNNLKNIYPSSHDSWKNMIKELAELQGLILLKKVNTQDCDTVIKSLLDVITGKLTVVNNIIKENLNPQQGGNIDGQIDRNRYNNSIYKSKYLKYKSKYLNLIKNKNI